MKIEYYKELMLWGMTKGSGLKSYCCGCLIPLVGLGFNRMHFRCYIKSLFKRKLSDDIIDQIDWFI